MKRFVAINLVFLILLSSVGFTLGSHFCGGKRVETKLVLITSQIGCGMETGTSSCKSVSLSQTSIQKTPCCNDVFQTFKSDNYAKQKEFKVELFKQLFTIIYKITNTLLINNNFNIFCGEQAHSPPLVKSIRLLIQCFRL